ncbi:MAG TPA: hypothetical protein VKA26_05135 [Ignavibacteriaceae bacterium]|nr:hypothetical protein [Ignavibacteriaceae bacterium]
MKTHITILFLILLTISVNAQGRRNMHGNARGKIEELEKIKLIETLKMDEQTTLKFFARRTEFQNKVKELSKKSDDELDKISNYIEKNSDKNSIEMKKMINDYLSYSEMIAKEKTNFINSLNDILTYEQISKLLIFEKKFREEIRKLLFRQGKGPDRN